MSMMYFFPILFGFMGLWPILGACVLVGVDPDTDELFDFAKSHENYLVREWHVFVWPLVLWLWFENLKERE